MATLIEQGKSYYLAKPTLETLDHEVTEWLSELEFCETELSFLNKLLDKYFLRVEGNQKLSALVTMEKRVNIFRIDSLKEIRDVIIHHEHHLSALDENKFSRDEQTIYEEHGRHTERMKSFMGSFKKIKGDIFAFVEKELRQEKRH